MFKKNMGKSVSDLRPNGIFLVMKAQKDPTSIKLNTVKSSISKPIHFFHKQVQ